MMRLLVALMVCLPLLLPRASETALDRYVAAPDASFTWKVVNELPAEGVTATLIDMTSQRWLTEREVERPLWTHWVTVVRPKTVTSDIGLLFITGGRTDRQPPSAPAPWLVQAARDTGTVVAELRMVPNQPVVFTGDPTHKARVEDDFIAYTWDHFIRTGDDRWPARLPMTKSAVRAMDTVTAFTASPRGGGHAVTRFVVSGASKRGWTAWTTAAVDRRVIAIAPAVIDLLNIEPSFVHHWQAYGAWSDAVKDYVDQGLMDRMGTPAFHALMRIEEPYEYRDRLTMPKFIVSAAGDEFFLPDSSQFYFDDLRGEKHLRYVPNANHSLDKTDALESVQAFYAAVVSGTPRPEIKWTFEPDGSIKVAARDRPQHVRLWQATNPAARNFRLDAIGPVYHDTVLKPAGPNSWIARVTRPPAGWTAFFVELSFPSGGKYPFKETTAVRVLPDTLPYPPPSPQGTAAATAPANYVETIPGTKVSFDMVAIPGGTFVMGSPPGEPGRSEDEGPAHEVRIAPFWMERTEATWDEYDAFAFAQAIAGAAQRPAAPPPGGADAITRPSPPYGDESFGFGKGQQPVINIQHHAAMEYCRWLSLKTGHTYRLPTEAEWEYAARAGAATAYAFGGDPAKLDAYAWYTGNSGGHPHPVGQKTANRWGLHDLHGNVAEWTLDHYDPREYTRVAPFALGPVRLPTDRRYPYVARGGSWDDPAPRLRSAARRASSEEWNRRDPQSPQSIWWHTDASFVGFRVVRAVDEQENLKGLRSKITPASR